MTAKTTMCTKTAGRIWAENRTCRKQLQFYSGRGKILRVSKVNVFLKTGKNGKGAGKRGAMQPACFAGRGRNARRADGRYARRDGGGGRCAAPRRIGSRVLHGQASLPCRPAPARRGVRRRDMRDGRIHVPARRNALRAQSGPRLGSAARRGCTGERAGDGLRDRGGRPSGPGGPHAASGRAAPRLRCEGAFRSACGGGVFL